MKLKQNYGLIAFSIVAFFFFLNHRNDHRVPDERQNTRKTENENKQKSQNS